MGPAYVEEEVDCFVIDCVYCGPVSIFWKDQTYKREIAADKIIEYSPYVAAGESVRIHMKHHDWSYDGKWTYGPYHSERTQMPASERAFAVYSKVWRA